ncbi:MAG: universal stress protein [Bacteroidales bacterium]
MKQIIVPLDFSDESMNALELALMISAKTKFNIQMVYVLKKSSDFSHASLEEEQRYAKAKFNELQVRYENKLGSGVNLTYIIKRGKIYDEIVEQAESFDDSIVVVSTHGASGFEEFMIGSNAFKIITASERPVIAIRHGIIPKSFYQILLPIDYSTDTRQKVPYTADLARIFGAKVHILAVSSGNDPDMLMKLKSWSSQVSEYMKDNGIESISATRSGDNISDLIAEYAGSEKIDLISIMTEQSSSITNFVLGNNAQQLLSKSPVPILCITPKELNIRGGFMTRGTSK